MGHFLKKSKILKGRLPPEDGSDWRETLGKRVSGDFAKMIFRAHLFFGGHFFDFCFEISEGRLPLRQGSDWAETFRKLVSNDFAKVIFRA